MDSLLKNGIDIDAEGGEYCTALQAASSKGHERLVRMLLDNNADVNTRGGKHGTAVQAAFENGHAKIVQTLLDYIARESS